MAYSCAFTLLLGSLSASARAEKDGISIYQFGLSLGLGAATAQDGDAVTLEPIFEATLQYRWKASLHLATRLSGGLTNIEREGAVDDRSIRIGYGSIDLMYYPTDPNIMMRNRPQPFYFVAGGGLYDVLDKEGGYSFGMGGQFSLNKDFSVPMLVIETRYQVLNNVQPNSLLTLTTAFKLGT